MSLINGMLRDLEARRSDGPGSPVFVEQIRAVPTRDEDQRLRWYLLAGVLFLALVAWIFLRPLDPGKAAKAPNPAMAGAAAPGPVPAAAAAAVSVVPAAAPAVATAAPTPAAPASAIVVAAVTDAAPPVAQKAPDDKPVAEAAKLKSARPAPPLPKADFAERKRAVAKEVVEKPRAEASAAKPADTAVAAKGAIEPLPQKRTVTLEEANPATNAMGAARQQVERGDVRGAIDTLERSLPEAAGRADVHAFLAALLQREEQHKQAVEHYLLAVQKSPQTGVWWLGLGISRQALQQNAEALEAFRRARASNSLSAELNAFVDARLAQLQR